MASESGAAGLLLVGMFGLLMALVILIAAAEMLTRTPGTPGRDAAGTPTGDGSSSGSIGSPRSAEGKVIALPEESVRVQGGGRITYKHSNIRISSPVVREILQRIADLLGATLRVTSGDRDRPLGIGARRRSLHLSGRAVDFRVIGMSDSEAFNRIRASGILAGRNFELGQHLPGGAIVEHLHLGYQSPLATEYWVTD